MITTCGIDIGSGAVKAVVMRSNEGGGRGREGAELLAHHTERIRKRDQRVVIEETFQHAMNKAGVTRDDLQYIATTGEGELAEFRTGHFYGMTAHARGAVFLDPEARAAVDVGALHARAIIMDKDARVSGYGMTSQCASGSGQFLENIARYLGVTLDEVGALSLTAESPEKVSSICAVLAETDVINMVSRGISLPNILGGIHESMAGRLAKLLRKQKFMSGVVLFTGGLAADVGLVAATERALAKLKLGDIEVRRHDLSVHAGAIGAALWGAYRYERLQSLGTMNAGAAAAPPA